MENRVQSIKLTDNETGVTYELDFSRDSIKFAEERGFKMDDVMDFPVTKFPELFYYAFRMHHKSLSRTQTDAIYYEKMGGYTKKFLERLVMLYNQAATANNVVDEEDAAKNSRVTVEL